MELLDYIKKLTQPAYLREGIFLIPNLLHSYLYPTNYVSNILYYLNEVNYTYL